MDLICFSHLRWNFVFQRPQHLMTRFAERQRVFFVEEPEFRLERPSLNICRDPSGVIVVTPILPSNDGVNPYAAQQKLLNNFFTEQQIHSYVAWYYSPMFLEFTSRLTPAATVYDCMDELSAFKNAPPQMQDLEQELLRRADLVFTGGYSLYEAKKHQHPNVFAFPSSIDVAHFAQARRFENDGHQPEDQRHIPRPRIGFCGVIDERMDLELIRQVASKRPHWQFVFIGPVVKIDAADLPRLPNLHYLGSKAYKDLPAYFAGWNVAILPFARNESTRFISPTKTPEYLAAGRPVVSTSIKDVVRAYGAHGVVHIADEPDDFIAATETALTQHGQAQQRKIDDLLSQNSWSRTWGRMAELVDDVLERQAKDLSYRNVLNVPPRKSARASGVY